MWYKSITFWLVVRFSHPTCNEASPSVGPRTLIMPCAAKSSGKRQRCTTSGTHPKIPRTGCLNYCGWKNSCTTLDGWNPTNSGINHLSTGARFFHSIALNWRAAKMGVPPEHPKIRPFESHGFKMRWVSPNLRNSEVLLQFLGWFGRLHLSRSWKGIMSRRLPHRNAAQPARPLKPTNFTNEFKKHQGFMGRR